jgi:hypothetical protein
LAVVKCKSVEQLFDELNLVGRNTDSGQWFFRGQGNSNWGLVPSLFRHRRITDYKSFECHTIESLRVDLERYSTLPPRLLNDFDYLLALAQHSGQITRLLDWTTSFLTGAYFAASSATRQPDDTSMSVYCFAPIITVGRHANDIKIVYPPAGDNENLTAQNGLFLKHRWDCLDFWRKEFDSEISTVEGFISPSVDSRIIRLDLPSETAYDLLDELHNRGINGRSLFPGMAGYARKAADFAWSLKR